MNADLLEVAEECRKQALTGLIAEEQARWGQYITPHLAARIIAGLPCILDHGTVRVQDPGAESGIPSEALFDRILVIRSELSIHIVAVENNALWRRPRRIGLSMRSEKGSSRLFSRARRRASRTSPDSSTEQRCGSSS